jgi:hypothetical protein
VDQGGRQFKDFAGYLWEAFEVKGREAGVPPGFRRVFFRSIDHPHLPPVPGPITTAPLDSLSLEQLRGFIKLGHSFPQIDQGTGAAGASRAPRAPTRSEWESFLSSVGSSPGPREPGAPTSPLPSAGSVARDLPESPTSREYTRGAEPSHPSSLGAGPRSTSEEPFYPSWLEEALEVGAEGAHAEVTPSETPEIPGLSEGLEEGEAWSPQGPVPRRHLYRGFESARLIPHRFHARVRVGLRDREFVGEAEGADVPGARVEVAARATLAALQKAEGNRIELALQGAKVVRAFDRKLVVVGVYALRGRDVTSLVGASLVRDSVEHAGVLAALQATNRWVTWAASRPSVT